MNYCEKQCQRILERDISKLQDSLSENKCEDNIKKQFYILMIYDILNSRYTDFWGYHIDVNRN